MTFSLITSSFLITASLLFSYNLFFSYNPFSYNLFFSYNPFSYNRFTAAASKEASKNAIIALTLALASIEDVAGPLVVKAATSMKEVASGAKELGEDVAIQLKGALKEAAKLLDERTLIDLQKYVTLAADCGLALFVQIMGALNVAVMGAIRSGKDMLPYVKVASTTVGSLVMASAAAAMEASKNAG